MLNKLALLCVERLICAIAIENSEKPFGGKVTVLGGEFWQCTPVVPCARRSTKIIELRTLLFGLHCEPYSRNHQLQNLDRGK